MMMRRYYRCLNCGEKSPSYFFYYEPGKSDSGKSQAQSSVKKTNNKNSSIQLTECSACQALVDPYMEREWLLVVMDLFLLRSDAYRHVLWNRLYESLTAVKETTNQPTSSSYIPRTWINIILALLILTWDRFLSAARMLLQPHTWFDAVERQWSLSFPASLIAMGSTISLYIWVCHKRLVVLSFSSSPSITRHAPDRFRNEFWIMAHTAIILPVLISFCIGAVVTGIWGHETQTQEQVQSPPSVNPWSFVDGNFGLAVWLALSQIYGLRAVMMDLPEKVKAA